MPLRHHHFARVEPADRRDHLDEFAVVVVSILGLGKLVKRLCLIADGILLQWFARDVLLDLNEKLLEEPPRQPRGNVNIALLLEGPSVLSGIEIKHALHLELQFVKLFQRILIIYSLIKIR